MPKPKSTRSSAGAADGSAEDRHILQPGQTRHQHTGKVIDADGKTVIREGHSDRGKTATTPDE